MKTSSPTLLPLLRSEAQGEIIAQIMLDVDEELTLSTIADRAGVSLSTVGREVDKLIAAALVTERRIGTARLVRANRDNPATWPLRDLIDVVYGPVTVIEQQLRDVPDVDEAYIYGSYAARKAGEPGASPKDIDVLVVGEAAREMLFGIAADVEPRVRREVNIYRLTASEWSNPDTYPFVKTLRSQPMIELNIR